MISLLKLVWDIFLIIIKTLEKKYICQNLELEH